MSRKDKLNIKNIPAVKKEPSNITLLNLTKRTIPHVNVEPPVSNQHEIEIVLHNKKIAMEYNKVSRFLLNFLSSLRFNLSKIFFGKNSI